MERFAHWKWSVFAIVVFLLIQVILAGYVIPSIQKAHPQAIKNGLLIMMDSQPLASASKEYQVINLYTNNIRKFVYLLYGFDFLIPASLTLFFLSLMGIFLKYLKKINWHFLFFFPLGTVLFDYLENINALFLISQYPKYRFDFLANLEGYFTAAKVSFTALVMLSTLILIVLSIRKYIRTNYSFNESIKHG